MTKSGIIKDERDTPTRRVRHRDGRLLAGGIGLTTGLGWSDRCVFYSAIFSFVEWVLYVGVWGFGGWAGGQPGPWVD